MNGLTLDEIRQIEMMNEQSPSQPQYNPNIAISQNPMEQQVQMQYPNVPQQMPVQQQVPVNIPEYTNENNYIPPEKWVKQESNIDPELLGSSKSRKKKKSKPKKVERTMSQFIYNEIKEPFIVLVLYLVLSHPIVFNLFASQIKYLRPGSDGQMHLMGFLIYGSILSLMFYLIKKFT